MKKTFGVETKFNDNDELSYHGEKEKVKSTLVSHYGGDTEEADYQHKDIFKK